MSKSRPEYLSIQVVWVDYCPPSPNKTRYQHWTVARKHVEAAKTAWLLSLQSSESARNSMMIICRELARALEIPSPPVSGSMIGTRVSNGNMAKPKPEAGPAAS